MAQELGRLPEIQDGISEPEVKTINKLAELYMSDPDSFGRTFEQMNRIGLPEFRRYCSPLQALFWLSKKEDLETLNSIIVDYSLERLLDRAWIFETVAFESEDEVLEIIAGIHNEVEKEIYREDLQAYGIVKMQRLLFIDYKRNPEMFSREALALIKKAKVRSQKKSPWSDFELVVDRLNSPELLDYYERRVIRYKYKRGYGEGPEEAERVFNNKYGHCAQITAFTVYILRRAGYDARRYIVANPALKSPRGNYHRACLFVVRGEKYIMDNGRGTPQGIVRFEDYYDTVSPAEAASIQAAPLLRTGR